MGIQNFPISLQAIIQQGFLEREFQHALQSRLGYRAVADREKFAVGIGETSDQDPRGPEAKCHDTAGAGHQHQPRQRPGLGQLRDRAIHHDY